jgi:hypothetical protein
MPLANFIWVPMLYAYTYAVWWVVAAGLVSEGIVYFIVWRKGFWLTVALTLSVNVASAICGVAFSMGSQIFVEGPESIMIAFFWSFAPLVFILTVLIEYFAGVVAFSLPRSWRTLWVFSAANVPSVGLAVYETFRLAGKVLTGEA